MLQYQTPGVYYERLLDGAAPAIGPLRTDVTGFVGISSRGPVDLPVPVQSFRQFQAYFGDFSGAGYLAYAVRAFFENGGRRCWVVRIASPACQSAETILQDESGTDAWRIAAYSPGSWGNQLTVRVVETHQAQTRSTPRGSTPYDTAVQSVSGFERAMLVRLSQGAVTAYKVVAAVDSVKRCLQWVSQSNQAPLPYEAALSGFNLDLPIQIESVEYTLLVWEAGRLRRAYTGLSLVPEHPRYAPDLLAPLFARSVDEGDPQTSQDANLLVVPAAPEPVILEEQRTLAGLVTMGFLPLRVSPQATLPLSGGVDGLANLQVYDFIGEQVDPLDSDVNRRLKLRGLRTLEMVSDVSVLAVPDIHIQPLAIPPAVTPEVCVDDPCVVYPTPPAPATPRGIQIPELPPVFGESAIYQVQAAMVLQCEQLRDRIALLDPPFKAAQDDALGPGAVRAWRQRFESKYAALYYPWLLAVDPLRLGQTRSLPPSGHVAGQYAQTDFQVGVHKAPANNPLVWMQDVSVKVNETLHGMLNEDGINIIRSFPGRGLRIFGARTVSSDPDWRYVNVRRLIMMIEKAVYLSTQWAVFEPNNDFTRAKLRLSLISFLSALWGRGALMGATPEAAFFVRCDETNNPPDERANGRMLAEVGVAPSQPFEFVVVRVGRIGNEFEISTDH